MSPGWVQSQPRSQSLRRNGGIKSVPPVPGIKSVPPVPGIKSVPPVPARQQRSGGSLERKSVSCSRFSRPLGFGKSVSVVMLMTV